MTRSLRLDVEMTYLRTKDGREVDARHLRGLEPLLDGPLLAGFVLYRGREVHAWDKNLFALPAPVLFAESV